MSPTATAMLVAAGTIAALMLITCPLAFETRAKMPIRRRPSSSLSSMRSSMRSASVVNSPNLIEAPSAPERSSYSICS